MDMLTTNDAQLLFLMDAYWRASNYLSVGQIDLLDNPLLKEPLKRKHISYGWLVIGVQLRASISFTYTSTASSKNQNLDMIYIIGPESSPASSAMGRPRPARWQPDGTATSSSILSAMVAFQPILYLNGYKIGNPCFLARIPQNELQKLFEGYGYKPFLSRNREKTAL
jgi:phosphoketolase